MATLSFAKGEGLPVALVRGGAYDGEILYLGGDLSGMKKPRIAINRHKYSADLKHLKPSERPKMIAKLEEALKKGIEADKLVGESAETKALYQRILDDSTSTKLVELDDDGLFEVLPNPDPKKREVWYIAGQSGSGKSYIAKQLAGFYHKLFPERGVYLVSKLNEDETLDALKFLKRINIQSFVDDYPALEEFRSCMIIFDDYDTLTGDADKVVSKIIDDLAIQGRHTNTTMLCLSHYLTNYKKTRLLLNEATNLVVYPLSTSYHALRYLLKNYVGVDEEDLKRHRKLGSRWLMYKKGYPQVMICQKQAEILHT
ncbi:MAG: putative packaging ATPase [Yellowstone Lake virophage 5]|uniref:Putative packaging ATPase n=1 Tax=Yellowstone Lake virophage 5 TaxID=1557033 RepID=A0A0A0RRZ4_9VIRU|nr:MAG: putative packaging ATPase [Yellowstone Lake virophage 5]AIW01859.1 MAG: putative packaging ATPase [Yellowstone Lake virophage 5]